MAPIPQKVFLAGRAFVPVGVSTVEHDIEFVRLLKSAGIDRPSAEPSETNEAFGWRIMQSIIEAGALLPLLGCLIIPSTAAPEKPGILRAWAEHLGILRPAARATGWTPEVQRDTVEWLKALDEPDDKDKVYRLVVELLFPFVRDALASWRPSPRSSGTSSDASASGTETPSSAGATSDLGAS